MQPLVVRQGALPLGPKTERDFLAGSIGGRSGSAAAAGGATTTAVAVTAGGGGSLSLALASAVRNLGPLFPCLDKAPGQGIAQELCRRIDDAVQLFRRSTTGGAGLTRTWLARLLLRRRLPTLGQGGAVHGQDFLK